MAGGPSQLETFDYKPLLNERNGQPLPDSVRMGQRLTGMSANQAILPLAGSIFKFAQHGRSGRWVNELLPHTAQVVDDRADLHGAFTEGEEVSVFRSAQDLRTRVGALLQDLPAAEAMGEAARRRAMREHTYMHRLRALLRAVGFAAPGPAA